MPNKYLSFCSCGRTWGGLYRSINVNILLPYNNIQTKLHPSEKTEAELWPFNDTEQTRCQNFQVPVWGPIRSQHWHQVLPTKLWLSALWSLKHILCVLSIPVCSLERLFQMGCVHISSEVRWCSFTFPFSSSATELLVPLESLILLSWPWSRLDQLCYLACLFGLRCVPSCSFLEPYPSALYLKHLLTLLLYHF